MKKILFFLMATSILLASTSTVAVAAKVTAGATVSAGQASSASIDVGVKQTFDPWVSTSAFELAPFWGLTGHVWLPKKNDAVWGATIPLGIKLEMLTSASIRPYISGSIGPSFVSSTHVGDRNIGSNVLIMTNGALGVSFGDHLQHNIEGQYTHRSTWGIASPDAGYDTYGVGYGYSF